LNNLVALGIGTIYPIGFAGEDGEGFELVRALRQLPGVRLDGFVQTAQRGTFTYCKPLVLTPGKPPVELNRLDSKNWTATPIPLQEDLAKRLVAMAGSVDAVIVLDQVDVQDTGVVAQKLLEALGKLASEKPHLLILADSRRGLRGFPPVVFKMNAAELATLRATRADLSLDEIKASAAALAGQNQRAVFISLAERGLLGATPDGAVEHVPALPVRGELDIVGAGDAVSANLTSALAAGATLREAVELANAAASVVVHKLGTTGTASVSELRELLS
jgi:bifunctional ADP-heptose synthase (sugar kinase/adenylyltransferase)